MAAPPTVHFRITPALEAALDRKIEEMLAAGVPPRIATKSAICRTIIAQQLGMAKDAIIADEVLNAAYAISRAIGEQVLNRLMQDTETLVEATIKQLNAE